MHPGEAFRFILDEDTAGRMDRVVMINDGRVEKKEKGADGVTYLVSKT